MYYDFSYFIPKGMINILRKYEYHIVALYASANCLRKGGVWGTTLCPEVWNKGNKWFYQDVQREELGSVNGFNSDLPKSCSDCVHLCGF